MYTLQDLRQHQKTYEKLVDKLIDTVYTPEHYNYLTEETRLNKLGIKIRSELGIIDTNPCLLGNTSLDCPRCPGRYMQYGQKKKLGKMVYPVHRDSEGYYIVKTTSRNGKIPDTTIRLDKDAWIKCTLSSFSMNKDL